MRLTRATAALVAAGLLGSCDMIPSTLETRRIRSPVVDAKQASDPRTPLPVVEITYRVDLRVAGGDGFASFLAETMADRRGWVRAGFVVREDPSATYTVVLADGPVVDQLCLPYETHGEYSCQNGPVVAINLERWRGGVAHWRDINAYRRMLLNHEMGHLLGQHHAPCPGRGKLAPIMFQQSSNLRGCRPNPWPLEEEIARAARHDLDLAPAYGA